MDFRLLGPLEVVTDDGAADVGAGKRCALLTYLLINANEVVPAERLIEELWGERAPATAAKSVQVYVSQLRKTLRANGDLLVTRGSGYVLNLDDGALDIQRFESRLAEAQQALEEGDARRAAGAARAALELWRGPALYDVAYESFAQNEAARLEELRLVATETRVDAELVLGEHARLVGELEQLVRAHPLRERLRAQLMLALYRCGRQSEALDVYRDARRHLMDELGLEPSHELRELEQQVLSQSRDLASPRVWRPTARRREAPEPAAGPTRGRRGARLVVTGAVLLAGTAAVALIQREGADPARGVVRIDSAANSAVALAGGRPVVAIPLPGRPTDMTSSGRTVWVTTIDSPALTSLEARTHKILRTIPLAGRPDGVAVGGGSVWVVDGSRGILSRLLPGYDRVQRRVSFPPAAAETNVGRLRAPRATVAFAGGAAWVSNGSQTLTRVEARTGASTAVPTPMPLNGLAAGAGALWGLSSATASIVRIDPRNGTVTDRVAIVARQGPSAPKPTAIAAAGNSVWVLNGNTATLTRIDAATRGVVSTAQLGIDRIPSDIAARGKTAWIADRDGTLTQVDAGSRPAKAIWIGGSLDRVAPTPAGVWVSTTALDQQLPGGPK